MFIFSKYKYLHVKIASLANVKSPITVGPISLMANVCLKGICVTQSYQISISIHSQTITPLYIWGDEI